VQQNNSKELQLLGMNQIGFSPNLHTTNSTITVKKVLLISLVNWDSLIEIPAILKNGGCAVDIFCVRDSWAIQNKFYDNWIEAPHDTDLFVDQIIELVEKKGSEYEWIIPGDDIIIRLLNEKITSEALFYKILPLTKIENRELLGSKAGFSSLCTRYGIKTPKYLIYTPEMTAASIGAYMGYPFLMKVDKSEGGFGVFLCENETSFPNQLAQVSNKENMVFQQFIQGYDINVEVLYRKGELMVYNYSRTLKIMGKFGVSTQRSFYSNTAIEGELIKMGRDLGLNGFGNVVFMYSEPEKTHYLIEVDVRPNAWMYYGKFTGNDFSEAVRRILIDDLRLVRPGSTQSNKTIQINLYKKDVYRCLVEKDLKGFLGWMFNKDGCWKYIPFYDSKLLKACNSYLFNSFRELLVHKIKG
jgi:predicted ATP-grasp superfamily ATP-dependent carboligase